MADKSEALQPPGTNLNYNSFSKRCIAQLQDIFHVPSQKDSWTCVFESATIYTTKGLQSPQQPPELRFCDAIKFMDVLQRPDHGLKTNGL